MAGMKEMSTTTSTLIKARKAIDDLASLIAGDEGLIAGDDCGCVGDVGCCKDKGCCGEGKCPAEMPGEMPNQWGCAGVDFEVDVKSRLDLVRQYLIQNKASVEEYFKSKGVEITL